MPTEDSNLEVYRLLYAHRKSILVFTFCMALASVVLTLPNFIPPLYKAEAIISPAGTNSAKLFIERDPKFGNDKEIDEQIQILQSAMVRDSIIRQFDLVNVYDIDIAQPTGIYDLYKEYDNSVTVDRTRYGFIRVRVFSQDAGEAAEMANALVSFGDKVKNSIIKKNMWVVFKSIERDYLEKGKALDLKAAEINRLQKIPFITGSLIRAKSQVEQQKEQIDLKAMIRQQQMEKPDHLFLLQDYDKELQDYLDLQFNYQQAFANANSDVPPSYIISPAEKINKKAYPPRTWIVLITTLASFCLACAIVVSAKKISELFRRIRTE